MPSNSSLAPCIKVLLIASVFREITSVFFSQLLVQLVSSRTHKEHRASVPLQKQAPQGATKSQGPDLIGKHRFVPPPSLTPQANTPCSNWQPNSLASYPAAPWQPQPLHMLCASSSHWHLAEPPSPLLHSVPTCW